MLLSKEKQAMLLDRAMTIVSIVLIIAIIGLIVFAEHIVRHTLWLVFGTIILYVLVKVLLRISRNLDRK
jgi:uncharacterized protein (DUF983 family)